MFVSLCKAAARGEKVTGSSENLLSVCGAFPGKVVLTGYISHFSGYYLDSMSKEMEF